MLVTNKYVRDMSAFSSLLSQPGYVFALCDLERSPFLTLSVNALACRKALSMIQRYSGHIAQKLLLVFLIGNFFIYFANRLQMWGPSGVHIWSTTVFPD